MDHGINYATGDVAAEVLRLTDGRGVDLVVDPVGGRTLEASIAALAYRGRISWVGRAGRDEAPPEVWPIMQKNGSLTGVFLGVEMVRNPQRTHPMIDALLRPGRHRRAAGRHRSHLPAGRGGRSPPLHREPQGLRARPARALSRRGRPGGAPLGGPLGFVGQRRAWMAGSSRSRFSSRWRVGPMLPIGRWTAWLISR